MVLQTGIAAGVWPELWDTLSAVGWQLVASALFIALVLLVRWFLTRRVVQAPVRQQELRRRWLVHIRRLSFLAILLGLVIIWAPQLHTMALSVVAILVAIVLATKELILCLSGGFLKASSGSFGIGDRIEVAGIRGDVIDQTLLTTRIMETGPGELTHQHTGRAVTLPNSVFLTAPVTNESFTEDYVLHVFTVPIRADGSWRRAEQELLKAAGEACAPFIEDARRHIARIASKQGLNIPPIDPRVILSIPDPGRIDLIVRVPVPARRKGRVEQDILRRYLSGPAAESGTA